jgi:hypothetical protein
MHPRYASSVESTVFITEPSNAVENSQATGIFVASQISVSFPEHEFAAYSSLSKRGSHRGLQPPVLPIDIDTMIPITDVTALVPIVLALIVAVEMTEFEVFIPISILIFIV